MKLDDSDFKNKLKLFVQKVLDKRAKTTMDVGLEVMRLSQREVPHDEGELQNSGTVVENGDETIVGYNKVYAARLHEHPEYNFQKGRKGRYLYDPIARNISHFLQYMGNAMKGAL